MYVTRVPNRGSPPAVLLRESYRERKLMVVAPPNSEPVKNRREGREKARGTDRKTT